MRSALFIFAMVLMWSANQYVSHAKSKIELIPVAQNGQKVEYKDGIAAVTSTKTHQVMVKPFPKDVSIATDNGIYVQITNRSSEPITVSLRNMTLVNGKKSATILSLQDIIARENKKSKRSLSKTRWLSVLGAVATHNTKRTAVAGTYNSTTQPTNYYAGTQNAAYSTNGNFNATITENDPAADNAQRAQIQENMIQKQAAISESNSEITSFYRENYFQTTTIEPGQSYGGLIKYEDLANSKNSRPMLNIQVGNELHEFEM